MTFLRRPALFAALAILAFEPSLIGHGSIVTTDMAISATSFGAVYALYRYGKERTWIRFTVAGLAMGLMLAAYVSIAAGLILDTVTRGRREVKLLAYLEQRAPGDDWDRRG